MPPYDPYNMWAANAAGAGAGGAGVALRQSYGNNFSAPSSPLAPGYGGLLGTGSYLGTMAAYGTSTSPFSIGMAPNLMGAPTMLPTPQGYVPVQQIPNGMGGYTYLPVGNPAGPTYPGGPSGTGGAGSPGTGGFQPQYSQPGSGNNLLGLSFANGGSGGNIFAGPGGGGMAAPTLGGQSSGARQPFGPTGIQQGSLGYNASQNTYAGRNLGIQTSPNGTYAQSGGTTPLGAGVGPANDVRPSSGYINGPSSPLSQPLSWAETNAAATGVVGGAPNQGARLVNYPDSLTGGVQFVAGPNGPNYTNPGSIGLPTGPAGQPSPGSQPGSTGFTYPSAFGSGGSYYSTPTGYGTGPTAQTLLGFGGSTGAPATSAFGNMVIGGPGTYPGSYPGYQSGGATGGFSGSFSGPNGGVPGPGTSPGGPGYPSMPSTSGPFDTSSPIGMAGNLLTNEIMRREGLLNTAQQQYQGALNTITGSPVAGGVNALLSDLISNPYPYSSDAMKSSLTEMARRRVLGGSQAAQATAKQAGAEAGMRGAETAGQVGAAKFKGNMALADAITQIEREMGMARTSERQAASGILGAGGQTLAQSVFGPQMEAASFFERRSNPEIQALVQLLGQDMALKVAQAAAASGAPGGAALAFGNPLLGRAFGPGSSFGTLLNPPTT